MPKNKKSRRKSRNQKCASKTELTTTLDKNGPDGNEKSTGSNEDVPCDSLEPSEKKRKSLHDATSTNDAQLQESVPSLARKKKKRKRSAHEALQNQIDDTSIPANNGNSEGDTSKSTNQIPEFPFPVDPDDHCESPIEAYRDIVPFLSLIDAQLDANMNNKMTGMLRIYDPYYCDGAVVRNFLSLGFTNVYNRKENCYIKWEAASTVSNGDTNGNIMNLFDVLVTNPPYSEDHIERLIQFVTSDTFVRLEKPWFLLLPQWVHKKDYYIKATTRSNLNNKNHASKRNPLSHVVQPFYLLPKKRYVYTPPPNFRSPTKSDVHKKSSPFISMWYCWGGTTATNEQMIQHFYQNTVGDACDLARSKSAIRDQRRRHTTTTTVLPQSNHHPKKTR